MTSEEWQAITTLFEKCEALSPSEWEETIFKKYSSNSLIAQKTLEMLQSQQESTHYFDDLGEQLFQSVDEVMQQKLSPGTQIGKYTIIKELGSGGMATVYLAERKEGDYSQKVAIKTLKEKVVSPEAMQHFHQEQQMLASLNHPHIAQIYDGGVTENGIAYFIMEWIEGLPVDRYCEEHELTLSDRLSLFKTIAEAVEFAHQHFVLHRDIKPGNILVSKDGHPKLLDFGIAQIAQGQLAPEKEKPVFGTPYYAPPEQLKGKPSNTASDVYQLGILLYKLLCGALPFEIVNKGDLLTRAVNQVENRPSDTSKIEGHQKLKGDLDAIVLKALEEQPSKRYQSVQELIRDIKRYENGYPVSAMGNQNRYLLQKYLARKKVQLISLSSIFLALSIGLFISIREYKNANEQKQLAVQKAEVADATQSFLLELFQKSNPEYTKGDTLTIYDLLHEGFENARHYRGPTVIKGEIFATIGDAYRRLGYYPKAKEALDSASVIFQQHPNYESKSHLNFLKQMAIYLRDNGQTAESIVLFNKVLKHYPQIGIYPEDSNYTAILKYKAYAQKQLGDLEGARKTIEEAKKLEEKIWPNKDNLNYAETLYTYASILKDQKEYKLAIPYFKQSLKICLDKAGKLYPGTQANINNLSITYQKMDCLKLAGPLIRKSNAIKEELYGKYHKATGTGYSNAAAFFNRAKEPDSAIFYAQKAIVAYDSSFHSKASYYHAIAYNNLGNAFLDDENYDSALKYLKMALRLKREYHHSPNSIKITFKHLFSGYYHMKDTSKAIQMLDSACYYGVKALGPNDASVKKMQEKLEALKNQYNIL